MAKWLMWITELINVNANINALIILIDFGFRIGELSLEEKNLLLSKINTESYNIVQILQQINVLFSASVYVDKTFVNFVLKEYVLANVITQTQANEIKSNCGL